ncbi:MAG: hypothetical protein AAFX03_00790 [Pseudomonadota bacterium]
MQHLKSIERLERGPAPRPRVRFSTALLLETGEAAWAYAMIERAFEDRCAFGPAAAERAGAECPSAWLSRLVRDVASEASTEDLIGRLIVVPTPDAALSDLAAPALCDKIVAGTRLGQQEFCFEVRLSAIAAAPEQAADWIKTARSRGFRVAIDARRAAPCRVAPSTWLMIDSLRVDADTLFTEAAVVEFIEQAVQTGVSVLADRPRWRDGGALALLGVDYGLNPQADA